MASDDGVLRILVSTDNHLGVWEKDEVRKDDSFVSFEEVFEMAARNNADFVLLGGDLFHDNKPSRYTIVRAIDIMRRHCMGDRPVRFQVLSDQAQNFTTGRVNYEDPNFNIGLPVLTIHGNHDDPAGAENLSAVDILSTCRLVNYFGKAAIEGTGTGKLRIAPVLLQKGATRVALYGLGNLRDERLCRLFQTPGHVEWIRPSEDKDTWFNIFVLHQNRVAHTQNAKNCLREGALAKFLDLVVWGHEHECLADPWESAEAGGAFSVMQPGSSVATALSEGEAKRKHVVMVEIMGHQWRTVKHPLTSVRPFQFASVVLGEQMELDPDNQEGVAEFLERKVLEMIDQAHRGRDEKAPELPLIRLRVDYSGFSTINTQRFGQKFVGKVANPNDMVLWQKAPQRKAKEAAAAGMAPDALIRPEALDESRIEDLIGQHLQHNLEILPEQVLTDALHEFVEKDNKDSWREAVARALQETQNTTLKDQRSTQIEQDDDLVDVIRDVNQRRKEAAATASQAQRGASQAAPSTAQQVVTQQQQQQQQASIANGLSHMQVRAGARGKVPSLRYPTRKPPRAPAAAPRRGTAATAAAGRSRAKPAASAAGAAARQSPLNFAPTQSRGSQGRGTQQGETVSVGVAAGRRGTSRAAASKAQAKLKQTFKDAAPEDEAEDDDEVQMVDLTAEGASDGISDSDDDDLQLEEEELEAPPPSATRKRGRAAPAAAAPAASGRRRGAAGAPSQQTAGAGVSVVVSDDEDDVAAAPSAGRRRLGGAGMLGAAGRSQLGTGSQLSNKGWGALKD
ncbi:hypothetical protein ABPG75_009091 [Micractinium tetrahymenae]